MYMWPPAAVAPILSLAPGPLPPTRPVRFTQPQASGSKRYRSPKRPAAGSLPPNSTRCSPTATRAVWPRL
eukprot:2108763-Rhodomonas_salina.2